MHCLACGEKLVEAVLMDLTQPVLTASTYLLHPGEPDAACRLVMETLADEVRSVLSRIFG